MGATETATFQLMVDARQAQTEIASLRTATATAGGSFDGLGKSIGGLGQAAARGAGAVNQLGSIMGQAGGKASQLLGLAGNLAGSFAAGGPFGLAMAAAAAGIGFAADRFDLFGTRAKKAAEESAKHFAGLRAEIDGIALQRQALQAGVSTDRFRQQSIVSDAERAARSAVEAAGGGVQMQFIGQSDARGDAWDTISVQMRERYDEAIAAAKEYAMQHAKLTQSILLDEETIASAKAKSIFARQLAEVNAPAKAAKAQRASVDVDFSDVVEKIKAKRAKDMATADLAQEKADKLRIDAAEDMANRLSDIHSDQIDRRISLEKWAANETAEIAEKDRAFREGIARESLGILTSATTSFVDDMVTGQKDAALSFGIAIMRMAGQSMIAHGINAMAGWISTAALVAAIPTAGASGIITGGMLIAGGVALGGVAAGLGSMAGGAGASTATATRDPGVNRGRSSSRSRGGRDSGGGASYVFNYGVAGPAADETARTISRMNDRAARRGFTDQAVRVNR